MPTADPVRSIDALRAIFLAVYGLLLVPAIIVGAAAFSDFNDRGCLDAEVVQCGDARAVMSLVLGYVLAGPAVWGLLKYLRNRATARKGVIHA